MGVRNYLIEGVSGAGKTAVAAELQRRGYQAIHGDRELAYRGDPRTGRPIDPETETPTALWLSERWIWDVEKVKAYIADQDQAAHLVQVERTEQDAEQVHRDHRRFVNDEDQAGAVLKVVDHAAEFFVGVIDGHDRVERLE